MAAANFSSSGVFLERFVGPRASHRCRCSATARSHGELGTRDCSLQRRNQKVVEEAPGRACPTTSRAVARSSRDLASSVNTVRRAPSSSCRRGPRRGVVLEMNTRLQVEHPVTEEVTGVDLGAWMHAPGGRRRVDVDGCRTAARRSPATPSRPACTPRIPGGLSAQRRDAQSVQFPAPRGGDVGSTPGTEVSCPLRPDARRRSSPARHPRGGGREAGGALAETLLYGVQNNTPSAAAHLRPALTDHTTSALADITRPRGPRIDVLRARHNDDGADLTGGSGVCAGRYSGRRARWTTCRSGSPNTAVGHPCRRHPSRMPAAGTVGSSSPRRRWCA
ncbi:hypothetical protein GS432_04100 [Rhodococcus hoagii]|nr:hypothetical protein [Prescottella equi]